MQWHLSFLKSSVILCLLVRGVIANGEEKQPTWKEARTAWKKTGAWLYDENDNPTKSAKDVRKVWFFDAEPKGLRTLPYLKALPDPKQVILAFGFLEPDQTKDLVEATKGLPPLRGIQVRYLWSDMTDVELCLISHIDNLRYLHLAGDRLKFTDAGMKCLGERCKLYELRIGSHEKTLKVTDEGLRHLKGMDSLSQFSIRNAPIQGSGLRYLEKLPITSLNLSGCPINDVAWVHLSKLRSLETLNLFETQVTGSGMEHLKVLPKLTKLQLTDTKVTAENVAFLADCRPLSDLNLAVTTLDDEAIPSLATLKQVKHLNLLKTKLTEAGVDRLAKFLPETEIHY